MDTIPYAIYSRDSSGILTRTGQVEHFEATDRAAYYPHPEPLLGWPERRVYWRDASGQSVGIAPTEVASC
jgi:hypothetical protein